MVLLEEQETVVNFQRVGDECTIWTSDKTMMTRLDNLCRRSPEYYKMCREEYCKGQVVGKFYKLADKTLVSFRSKKVKQNLTDEEKKERAERLHQTQNNA